MALTIFMLKQRKPDVQIIAVEPANSPVITQRKAGEDLQPGKGHPIPRGVASRSGRRTLSPDWRL